MSSSAVFTILIVATTAILVLINTADMIEPEVSSTFLDDSNFFEKNPRRIFFQNSQGFF